MSATGNKNAKTARDTTTLQRIVRSLEYLDHHEEEEVVEIFMEINVQEDVEMDAAKQR